MKNKKNAIIILLLILCIGGSVTYLMANRYDYIGEYNQYNLAKAEKKGKFGFVDKKKKPIVPIEYDKVEDFTDTALAIVTKDNKLGCVNAEGSLIIPTMYSEIEIGELNKNKMALVKADGVENFVDVHGKKVYESFERVESCEWIKVKKDGRYGCIDNDANTIMPCEYAELDISYSYGESVMVTADGIKNFLSMDGKALYDEVSAPDSNGWTKVKADGKYGYVDQYGNVVVPAEYETLELEEFQSSGYAKLLGDGKLNFVDINGNLLYQQVGAFGENGLAPVQDSEGFWGYIDKNGTEVIDCYYQEANEFGSNGLAKVKEGRLYGYINELGVMMIQAVYEELSDFSESGVALAKLGGHSKFIDCFGGKKYDYVSPFNEGIAFARENGVYFFVNENGDRINENTYDKITYLEDISREEYSLRIGTKYGLANLKGEELIPAEYDGISQKYGFNPEYIKVGYSIWDDGKYGYISVDGSVCFEPNYKEIGDIDEKNRQILLKTEDDFWEWRTYDNELLCKAEGEDAGIINNFFIVINEDNQSYYGKSGKLLFEGNVTDYWMRTAENGLCCVFRNDNYGIIDEAGNKFLDVDYKTIFLYQKIIIFQTSDENWGAMDYDKNILIEPEYSYISYNKDDDTYLVEKDGKYGCMNSEREFIIPCQFDLMRPFQNGCAVVTVNEKDGVINRQGQFVIAPAYELIINIHGGNYFRIYENSKIGIADKNGKIIIWPSYDDIAECEDKGIWIVEQNDFFGVLNENGESVIPLNYSWIHYYENYNCLAAYDMDDRRYYFDTSGNEIIPGSDWKSGISEDGLVVTSGDTGYGIYDITGRYVGYNEYELMSMFSQGLSYVRNADYKYGFINDESELVIPFEYEDADIFSNDGFAAVYQDGKWGFIDETGNMTVPCIYDEVDEFCYGRAAVCKNGKWGYININGEEVIPPQYDQANPFNYDKAYVETETDEGMEEIRINYLGEVIE